MIVYIIQSNVLYKGGHYPTDFTCEPFGESGCLEWHKSLDLMLAKYNNIKFLEDVKGETTECFLFMAELPKRNYKAYRKEYDKEGYSEIAENFIDYNWTIIASKKQKH
jgi:hypothetical protein